MSTLIQIPGFLIEANAQFDLNDFLIGQGLTPESTERTASFWIATVTEDLNAGQQTALAQLLQLQLDTITFTVI